MLFILPLILYFTLVSSTMKRTRDVEMYAPELALFNRQKLKSEKNLDMPAPVWTPADPQFTGIFQASPGLLVRVCA